MRDNFFVDDKTFEDLTDQYSEREFKKRAKRREPLLRRVTIKTPNHSNRIKKRYTIRHEQALLRTHKED